MPTTNRVQPGVPTGGQFAPTTHAESDVELTADEQPTFTSIGSKGEHPPTIALRLAALKEGDPVQIVADGRTNDVTVTREFRRMDGGGFGSLDHGAVTVGYGPGRWNTEVTAARISAGYVDLRVPSAQPTSPKPQSDVVLEAPESPARREQYPANSPAANVAAFRGKPIDQWFDEGGPDSASSLITADGSYGIVSPDHEPTGHWFVDITFADGENDGYADGGCRDDKAEAQASCERTLNAGLAAYKAGED